MLFHSAAFLFAFLPATLVAWHLLGSRFGWRAACAGLVLASLAFYGWWNPVFLLLLVAATLVNAGLGRALCTPGVAPARRRLVLWAGVAGNLALLGYFKYAGFLATNLNAALGTALDLGAIVLPLGISFFTFQKIAFLVDAWRGEVRRFALADFFLFVTFFPQLIAGPIVHHREMLPQFARPGLARLDAANLAVGLTVFAVGLFKKVVVADGCGTIADPVFLGFGRGGLVDSASAWAGALAYAFQLYFDFSGYSDMAVGLARMFNIELPVNFNSPYKAASIVEFWRRWHITLSRFLRDYVYFALGGNRRGAARRYANLLGTMLLGGLWHGASWSFVLWGGVHGLLLAANHAWRALRLPGPGAAAGRLLTFVAVVSAWVPFRMPELGAARRMLEAMYDPIRLLPDLQRYLEAQPGEAAWLALVAVVTFACPNVYQLFRRQALAEPPGGAQPQLEPSRLRWSASAPWALAAALLLGAALMQFGRISPFLYFQF